MFGANVNHNTSRTLIIAALFIILTAILTALVISGCGNTTKHRATHAISQTPKQPVLTYQQGANICNTLNTWAKHQGNVYTPRLPAVLILDAQTIASGTNLGTDLESFESELQQLNSVALLPVNDPAEGSLENDCLEYGVTYDPDPWNKG
jgi:hypothetical protein